MQSHIHIDQSPEYTSAILEGSNLNNQALEAERNGDLLAAEQFHLRALELKERHLGPDAVSTALTKNALGELYIKLGKLDEAEGHLKKAVDIRSTAEPAFDAAVSRENLAQLYEIRGKLKEARDTRLLGSPDKMACGYYHVSTALFLTFPAEHEARRGPS